MLNEGMVTQSWDTAIKAAAHNDASVCLTFKMCDGVHRLVDMVQVRAEYPELRREVVRVATRFRPQAILLEDKASGQSLLQDLRRDGMWPLIGIEPKGDKLVRVARITPMLEAGLVALPRYAPWLAAFEAEVAGFPNAAHDDVVDALSQYLNWVREQAMNTPQMRRL